jgi:hypothetical protein
VATEWKVRYKDGRLQRIPAVSYTPAGENHIFEDNGEIVAVIDRKEVEGVTRADIPDPETPGPVIA